MAKNYEEQALDEQNSQSDVTQSVVTSTQSFQLDALKNEPTKPKFSLSTFAESANIKDFKGNQIGVCTRVGAGVQLPTSVFGDSTKVVAGVEAGASLSKGMKGNVGIAPSLRITQNLGKNTELMAKVTPTSVGFGAIFRI